MTARRTRPRSPRSAALAAGLLAATLLTPAAGLAQTAGDFDADSAPDWRAGSRLSPTGRRRVAARLAQRERDAARRRNRYAFGRGVEAGPAGVPGAALQAPGADPAGVRSPLADAPAPNTAVRVKVLTDGVGGPSGALAARRWSSAFAALRVPVQVRSASTRDTLGVTESTRAGLRTVEATGRLTAGGELSFGEVSFAPADRAGLERWVADLRAYGAEGSPAGRPLWGLSEPAFRRVLAALSEPAPAGFAAAGGGTLGAALGALELPAALPLNVTPAAEAVLAAPGAAAAPGGRLPALSKGTALAVALAKRGLAFRPRRRPDGTVELLIVPRPAGDPAVPAPGSDPLAGGGEGDAAPPRVWPSGWELAGGADRARAARTLFALSDLGLEPAPLPAFAQAASEAAGVPVVLDDAALAAAGVDRAAVASVPPGRGTWATALRYAFAEHRLVGRLRRDEAGAAFLWVTPAVR